MSVTFDSYNAAAETLQSLTRVPGSAGSPAVVSGLQFKSTPGWQNATATDSNLAMRIANSKGTLSTAPPGQAFYFNCTRTSGNSFQMWDSREY